MVQIELLLEESQQGKTVQIRERDASAFSVMSHWAYTSLFKIISSRELA